MNEFFKNLMTSCKLISGRQRPSILCFVSFFFISFLNQSLALESVSIREVGPRKKTIVINIGSNELVSEGDQAYFVVKSEKQGLKGRKVGKGEAVKVFASHSYWYMREVELPQRLKKGEELLFAPRSAFMKGREKYQFKKKKLIFSKKNKLDKAGVVSLYKEGSNKNILKKQDEHRVAETIDIYEEAWKEESDIELLGLSHLSRKEDIIDDEGNPVETNDADLWQRRPEERIVNKKMRDQEFEDRVEYYLSKVEDPELDLDHLYEKQREGDSDGLVHVRPSLTSIYKKVQRKQDIKKIARRRALEYIQRTGPGWSAELSDDTLRKFMVENGLNYEKLRQTYSSNNFLSHEVYLNFVTDVIDQTTEVDERNRGIGFGFSIGYELPLKKIALALNYFSLQTEYRKERNNFAVDDENLFMDGSSFLFGLNWFPYYAPSTVDRFVPFVGVGMRWGRGILSRISFTQDYSFNFQVLPSLQVGTKYRFTINESEAFGARFVLSLEKNRLDILDATNVEEVPNNVSFTDLKLALGLSYYF